jgi:hypothetical protein
MHDTIRLAWRDSIEWAVGNSEPMQLLLDFGQRSFGETRSDSAGVDQPPLLVAIAEHERPHRCPALQRGESADKERLHADAFDLQPIAGAAASGSRIR